MSGQARPGGATRASLGRHRIRKATRACLLRLGARLFGPTFRPWLRVRWFVTHTWWARRRGTHFGQFDGQGQAARVAQEPLVAGWPVSLAV